MPAFVYFSEGPYKHRTVLTGPQYVAQYKCKWSKPDYCAAAQRTTAGVVHFRTLVTLTLTLTLTLT